MEAITSRYMVASGLPTPNGTKHVSEVRPAPQIPQVANLAMDLMTMIPGVMVPHNPRLRFATYHILFCAASTRI